MRSLHLHCFLMNKIVKEFLGQYVLRNVLALFLFFSFKVIVIIILVLKSVFRIFLASTCEDSSVWVEILSSCVGYVLPSPRPG